MKRLLKAGSEFFHRNSEPKADRSDSQITMFPSSNIVITGGTFNQTVNATGGPRRRPTADSYNGGISGIEVLSRHIAAGAMHDSAERSNASRCHPGTRVAVLNDIIHWIEDKHRKTHILWLHGPAGTGKSSICQTLAEMFQDNEALAASFFFDQGDDERSFIPTIAYQIAHIGDELKKRISSAVLQDPQQIFSKSLPTQMRQLIIQPLKKVPDKSIRQMLLLLDGLDECRPEDSQENILQALYGAVKSGSFPLCILISSRNEPHILDAFEGDLRDFTRVIALDEKYNPDEDIATYLRSSFASILWKHRRNRSLTSSWPSESTLQTLVSNASGQFIYAATIIRFVDVRHQSPSHRLDMAMGLSELHGSSDTPLAFAELDKLYQGIFREVFNKDLTLRILGSILLLQSPICLEDLECLLGLQPGETEIALSKLHSVLNISDIPDSPLRGRFVHLYHESLKDFLFDARRSDIYYIECDVVHHDLAQQFFRCSSKKPSFVNERSVKNMIVDWVHHMSMLKRFDDDLFAHAKDIKIRSLLKELGFDYTNLGYGLLINLDFLDQLSGLTNRFRQHPSAQSSVITEKFTHFLNLYCRHCLLPRFEMSPEIQHATLAILAMFKQDPTSPPAALGCLLQLNWSGFVLATLALRPFMAFNPSIKFISQAFSEYISDPARCGEFNPSTPDIHADLTIYCLEYMKRYHSPNRTLMSRTVEDGLSYPETNGPEEAYQYATTHWREHLRHASARRLLNYAYFVNARDGHVPICTHEQQCNIRCEVTGLFKCIEERIIASEETQTPQPTSKDSMEQEHLYYLKEVIDTKYLGTLLFSRVKPEMDQWSQDLMESYLKNRTDFPKARLRNDISTYDYDVQGVLWASRKGYKGKWPL